MKERTSSGKGLPPPLLPLGKLRRLSPLSSGGLRPGKVEGRPRRGLSVFRHEGSHCHPRSVVTLLPDRRSYFVGAFILTIQTSPFTPSPGNLSQPPARAAAIALRGFLRSRRGAARPAPVDLTCAPRSPACRATRRTRATRRRTRRRDLRPPVSLAPDAAP